LAPIVAGFLFAAGYSLPTVALLLAFGSLLAAGMLMMLALDSDRPPADREARRVDPAQNPAGSRA
jgi:hypothetical protein